MGVELGRGTGVAEGVVLAVGVYVFVEAGVLVSVGVFVAPMVVAGAAANVTDGTVVRALVINISAINAGRANKANKNLLRRAFWRNDIGVRAFSLDLPGR